VVMVKAQRHAGFGAAEREHDRAEGFFEAFASGANHGPHALLAETPCPGFTRFRRFPTALDDDVNRDVFVRAARERCEELNRAREPVAAAHDAATTAELLARARVMHAA